MPTQKKEEKTTEDLLKLYQQGIRSLKKSAKDNRRVEYALRSTLKCQIKQLSYLRMAFGENLGDCTCDDVWPCLDC